ncbi:glycosyltransferase family 4 protein [archaeon]|nr:glycosyltransferase family 4 protein [Nanoarchaeota archaeon]MCG2723877.1 glycosyltransferase family 4 protein [archaeon]
MNVLIICPYFYPEGGGLENYAYNISKGLVKKGFKVTVLCSTKEGKDKDEVINGVRVIRQKPNFIVSNTPIKLNLYATISDLLKKEKFDLVNAHTPVPYYADMACMAANKRKIPFYLTYHNDNTHPNFFVNFLCNVYNYTFNKMLLNNSTKIITPSPYCFNESKFLLKHKEKLSLIPPGVDLDKFYPGKSYLVHERFKIPKKSKIVMFVGQMGRFHKHKGVDILIKAFKNVAEKIPSAYLVLVGKGDMVEEYRNLSKELGIADKVIFTGFVSDEELPEYYRSADVVALTPTTVQEGFGMTLIEAMACGKPVIGTKIGGIKYIIKDGETGFLVGINDAMMLELSMIKILLNEKLTEKMGVNGYKNTVKKYMWSGSIATMRGIF